jgi:hypothetical protein
VLRLFAFVGVIGTAAWFGNAPGWEPIVAFVAALGTLLYEESQLRPKSVPRPSTGPAPADMRLLESFISEWRDGGPLEYFATRTAANAFAHAQLFALEELVTAWDPADREFLNPSVEAARRKLLANIARFVNYVAMHTFPLGDKSGEVSREWSQERQRETIEHIDKTAQELSRQYKDFVRLARRVLLNHGAVQ